MKDKPGPLLIPCVAVLACLGIARPARGDESLLDELSARRANRLSGQRNLSVTEQVNVGFPSAGQRQNVSAQDWLNYELPRGGFLESNATVTADWEGTLADRWTVPIAGGFGKVFTLAGQALSASAQGQYNVKEPPRGPSGGGSLSLQLLLP